MSVIFLLFLGVNMYAQPANDEPCNAITLNVGSSCNYTSYTNVNATPSAGVSLPGCANYQGGDVWFKFTMPNNGFHVYLDMRAGSLIDGGMAVYSGPSCSSLNLVSCDDNSGVGDMPSLSVDDGCLFGEAGQTFWIRVWEVGNDNNGTFDICAYADSPAVPGGVLACTTNPIAGNTCCDAILLSDLLDGYCGNTGGYTANPAAIPSFCAALENNTWIAFNAADPTVEIDLTSSNCRNGNGIQAVIFQTLDCANFAAVSNCWTPNPAVEGTERLTATGLTPGETYYLMVDGWSGDSCDYTISVISGVEMTNVTADDYEICLGQSSQLQVNVVGVGPYTYLWSPSTGLSNATIANPVATPTTSTDYTVTVTGPSSTSTHTVSIIVYPSVPNTPNISGSNMVCQFSNGVTYNASATYATSYNWTVNGGGTIVGSSTDANVNVDWGASGGDLCVTAINECGNSTQACMNVGVLTQPNISANDPPVACVPNSVNLTSIIVSNTGSGGAGFLSLSYHADQASAEAGSPTLPSPVVSTSGTYWIRMQTSSTCYDVTPVAVTIEDPDLIVVDPPTTCSPNTIDLNSVSVIEQNGYPGGTKTYYNSQTDAENGTNARSSSVVFTAGTYWVRYETPNACAAVAPININISLPPNIADVTPAPICPGTFIDLDTITLVDANNTTITATYFYNNLGFAQSNLTFLAMPGTIVTGPGTYWVWNGTADGCFDITQINITEHSQPIASVSSDATVCPGDSAILEFTFFNGTGPYDVEFNDGLQTFNLNGISDGHTEKMEILGGTTFTLSSITDNNGCNGVITGLPASITVSLAPTATLSGGGTVCENTSVDLTFNLTGSGPYNVTYTDGSQNYVLNNINDGHMESVLLTSSTTFSLVTVTDASGCSGNLSGTANFTVFPELQVTNRNENCNSTQTAYTVSFEITGGDPGTYLVSGAGSLVGNVFTSDPVTSNTPYNFIVSDGSGCPTITVSGQRECLCTTNAGTMLLDAETACAGATVTATHNQNETLAPGDLLVFAIHDNAGTSLGNIFGYNNTPTFGLLAGMMTGQTYYISPVAGPDNGSGAVDLMHPCLSVGEGTPVTFVDLPVATLSGGATICQGDAATLTFTFTAGTGPFDVVYSEGGNTVNLDDINDGHQINVTPTLTTSYTLVSVTDNTAAACSGNVSGAAIITVTPTLGVLNVLTTCNAAKTEYTVSFDISGGDPMSYAVSGAGTLTGASFVSDPIISGGNYSFTISDGSPCSDVVIADTRDCDCITSAGTMDGTVIEACTDETVTATHNGDEVLDPTGPDILQYILHENPGATPGVIFATSPTPQFSWMPGMTPGNTYFISAIAGPDNGTGNVDPAHKCYRVSTPTPVIFQELPVATISGTASVCDGETATLTFNFTAGTGPFDVVITDSNGNASDETLNDIIDGHQYQVTPTADVNYTILSVTDNTTAACAGGGNGNAAITVIDIPDFNPPTFGCNSTNIEYQVMFEITGGDAANYVVTGGGTLDPLTNIFTSDWIPSGDPYSFEITDGSGCPPVIVSGQHTCSCTTDAGLMLDNDLEVCADQTAVGTHLLNSFTLDGNDVIGFVLHDSPTATLGTVLLSNSIPEFNYDPSLSYGTTYYISAVIGNDSGTGFPVLDISQDVCLSVSAGQAVVFYEVPTASLTGSTTICEGDTTLLTFNLSGNGPFEVDLSNGSNTFTYSDIQDGHTIEVDPSTTTTYTITAVSDSGPLSCAGTLDPATASTTIDVIDVPEVNGPTIDCNISGTVFTVSFTITGGSGNYQISGDVNQTLAGNSFTSQAYNGGDTYYFEITDGSGCPPIIITDTEFCNCTPDIRPLITFERGISCAGVADGALNVIPINGQAPHRFNWSNGDEGDQATGLGTGWHFVTMTDANSCESIDSFFLQEPLPIIASLTSTPVSCYGDEDGSVRFFNVQGGSGGEYRFTLNGETSFFDSIYYDIPAGDYEARIIDANGCEWQDSISVIEPEELTVDLGDDHSIFLGDSVRLFADVNLPIDTFYWSPRSMMPCTNCSVDEVVRPEHTVIYRVRVVNAEGCEAEDAVLVHVKRDVPIYIPSAFTPDGDGFNETLTIYGSPAVEQIIVLRIYSRWGGLLYEARDLAPNDESRGWDGQYNATKMSAGVYVYYVEAILSDGTRTTLKGDFTLMR